MASGFVQRWKGKVTGALGIFTTLQATTFTTVTAALTGALTGVSAALKAGASVVNVGGVVKADGAAVANSATTSLQTLNSGVIPANSMDVAGRGYLIKAWGVFAGNAQNKSIELDVGGVKLQSGSSTQSGVTWELEARVIKKAGNSQAILLKGSVGTTLIAPSSTSDTSTDTTDITVAVKATSGSGSAADITQNGLLIEYQP